MNEEPEFPAVADKIARFLSTEYREEVGAILQKYPDKERSVNIDWTDLFGFDPDLADDYLAQPEIIREHFGHGLVRMNVPIPEEVEPHNVNFRLYNLGDPREHEIGEYRPELIGESVSVRGQVAQITKPYPQLDSGTFRCERCGTKTEVRQAGEELQEPHECQGCERKGPFTLLNDRSEFTQTQVLRLQQPPEKTTTGEVNIDVTVSDDLAQFVVEGGERVTVSGILDAEQAGSNRRYDYTLQGDYIEVEEGGFENIDIHEHREEIEAIRESEDPFALLVESFATHLSRTPDLEYVIEAVVLQMFGTYRKAPNGGPTYRGDFHVLLLGDPGTAKSEVLLEAEKLSPRAKFKSGKSVTEAGMTAAAIKDDFGGSSMSLKAGLLVLASGGLACLDEIDKAHPEALNAAHTALENQRVGISKGGIDADLPARTSLLAAGNPKHGRFDSYDPIPEQIDLPPSLMSRFDLMFMLKDEPSETEDKEKTSHVLRCWRESALRSKGEAVEDGITERDIDEELYRAYVAYAKQEIEPTMGDEIEEYLEERFLEIRLSNLDADDGAVPVTLRKLEALLRLAEASARARLSETVEQQDADRAVRLVTKSMEDVGMDPQTGEFDADIVTTGTSHSQKKEIRNVRAIVHELESEHENGAREDDVLERAQHAGISRNNAKHHLEKLSRQGDIYEPTEGYLRVN